MSTPLRHAKHIDPAVMYVPPRVRQGDLAPTEPSAPAANSDRGSVPLESRAYWVIIRAQRRLALDPECIPEPPQSQPDGRFTGESQSRLLAFWVWRQSWSGSWCRSLAPACCLKAILCGRVFWGIRSPPIRQSNFQKCHCRTGKAASLRRRRRNQEICKNRGAEIDLSEFTAVAPAPSVPVAPGLEPSSAPNRTLPEFVTRQLDRDELASMFQRADDFIKLGDSLRRGSCLNAGLKLAKLAQH